MKLNYNGLVIVHPLGTQLLTKRLFDDMDEIKQYVLTEHYCNWDYMQSKGYQAVRCDAVFNTIVPLTAEQQEKCEQEERRLLFGETRI